MNDIISGHRQTVQSLRDNTKKDNEWTLRKIKIKNQSVAGVI
jgi:hypothetical protein